MPTTGQKNAVVKSRTGSVAAAPVGVPTVDPLNPDQPWWLQGYRGNPTIQVPLPATAAEGPLGAAVAAGVQPGLSAPAYPGAAAAAPAAPAAPGLPPPPVQAGENWPTGNVPTPPQLGTMINAVTSPFGLPGSAVAEAAIREARFPIDPLGIIQASVPNKYVPTIVQSMYPPGSIAALDAATPSAVPGVPPAPAQSAPISGATRGITAPAQSAASAMSVGAPGTLSYTLNQIKQHESVGIANGLGISPYSVPPSANINFNRKGALHSEASGAYQFQPGTWRMYTNLSGIGQEYPQAYLAPPAVQDAVAAWAAINGPGVNSTSLWAASAPPGGYPAFNHVDITPQQLLAGGTPAAAAASVNPKTGLAITADVNPGTLTRSDINAAPPPPIMPTLPGGSDFTRSLYGGQLQWGSLPQSYQAALTAGLGANAPAAYEAERARMASATEQAQAALGYGSNVLPNYNMLPVAPPTSQQVIAGINPNPYSTAPVNLAAMSGGLSPGAPTVQNASFSGNTPSVVPASLSLSGGVGSGMPGLGSMNSGTVPPGNSSIGSTLGGMAAALGNMFGGFAPTFSGGSAFSGPPGGSSFMPSGADFSSQNQTMPGSGGGFF